MHTHSPELCTRHAGIEPGSDMTHFANFCQSYFFGFDDQTVSAGTHAHVFYFLKKITESQVYKVTSTQESHVEGKKK